jgi:hypothetical protein
VQRKTNCQERKIDRQKIKTHTYLIVYRRGRQTGVYIGKKHIETDSHIVFCRSGLLKKQKLRQSKLEKDRLYIIYIINKTYRYIYIWGDIGWKCMPSSTMSYHRIIFKDIAHCRLPAP